MNNTLRDGDRVFILKHGTIVSNSIVVFGYDDHNMVKRCVALPGETIQIINGQTFVNNRKENPPAKAILIGKEYISKNSHVNPFVYANYGMDWNLYKFGPYKVPYKGMKLELTNAAVAMYKTAIMQDLSVTNIEDVIKSGKYIFKNDFYFLMGDNRPGSEDSRTFGPIAKKAVKGKAVFYF